ncbi:hypothetical protein SLEP1_g35879 [Rubroshorea leprosula]|uniref:Uncharacterized protein n=1 Tax=Rubroshorea leprosula TaxID=152421 RepID=A0AAV5KPT6_9ROSI|nr:hypothetical protein SLEP1_g35879 [Rubroshorea leprosula]
MPIFMRGLRARPVLNMSSSKTNDFGIHSDVHIICTMGPAEYSSATIYP